MPSDHISVKTTYVTWCEEHFWNVSVLQYYNSGKGLHKAKFWLCVLPCENNDSVAFMLIKTRAFYSFWIQYGLSVMMHISKLKLRKWVLHVYCIKTAVCLYNRLELAYNASKIILSYSRQTDKASTSFLLSKRYDYVTICLSTLCSNRYLTLVSVRYMRTIRLRFFSLLTICLRHKTSCNIWHGIHFILDLLTWYYAYEHIFISVKMYAYNSSTV